MGVCFSVGNGSVSDILARVAANPLLLQWSALVNLVNSLGVAALAALCWWMIEALFCAIAQIGALALVPLSHDFIAAGAPAQSCFQSMGAFLYQGIAKILMTLHMVFYCAGGIIWYSLFFKSRYVPRPLSLFGIAAVCASLIGMAFGLFGYVVPIFVSLPILPRIGYRSMAPSTRHTGLAGKITGILVASNQASSPARTTSRFISRRPIFPL